MQNKERRCGNSW